MDYEKALRQLHEKRARQKALLDATDEHIAAITALQHKTEPPLPLSSDTKKK